MPRTIPGPLAHSVVLPTLDSLCHDLRRSKVNGHPSLHAPPASTVRFCRQVRCNTSQALPAIRDGFFRWLALIETAHKPQTIARHGQVPATRQPFIPNSPRFQGTRSVNQAESSTPEQRPVRGFDWETLQSAAGLAVLVAIFYWPTLNNGFVWDDNEYVQNNPQLRSVEGLYNIWFKLGAVPQYYPLVHTTFWIEYQAWGLRTAGYHATNLILHAVCAILVWRLLVRLAVPGAWVAAAIFAVHPVEVETVAWVSERKNVLSCVLALGSLLAYLRFAPCDQAESKLAESRHGSWGYYALALVLYIGAMLSKTVTVSTPAVLLVIYWWKRGRLGWRDVLPLVPFFAVGVPLAYITVWMEREHVGAAGADWNLSPVDRVLVAGRALWFYAGKLLWPYPLIFLYYRWTIDAHVWWQYLYPLAALVLVVALWLARNTIGRGPLAAALIFGGVLLPALGFFDVYPFRFSFVADHFQYHASIALIALVTATATVAFERWTSADSPLRVLAAGGVILVLGALTYQRAPVYRDLMTLSQDTLVHNPNSWSARYNLGDSLLAQGKLAEGIKEMREAVRLSPEQTFLRTGLASALFAAGEITESEEQFRQVLAADLNDRTRADALVRYGVVQVSQGHADEAIELYRQALALRPDSHRALFSYGLALAAKGDSQGAIEKLRKAIEISPFDPEAQHALGVILSDEHKIREATEHLQMAVDYFPGNAQFRQDLGNALLTANNLEAAQQHLAEAVRLNPNSAPAHNLLGNVLAKRRNYGAAIREFEAALRIDPDLAGAKQNLQRAREARSGQ